MGQRLDNQLRGYWDDRITDRKTAVSKGYVLADRNHGRYHVITPFSERFQKAVRLMGGRWKPRSYCWSVPTSQRTQLRQLITDCFGAEKVPQELRDE